MDAASRSKAVGGSGAATAVAAAPRARADAVRNRERLVSAAREAFVVHGADAPLDDIARRAGVGNATLYRHFADRNALVHGVVLAVTERIADRAQAALDESAEGGGSGQADAFEALRHFVFAAVEERIGALCPLLSDRLDRNDPRLLAARQRLEGLVRELVQRAKEAGRLRPDIEVGDLLVAISQLTRPLPGTGCAEIARFVERHVQLYLDGLQAPARSELPGHAATLEDLRTPA
ncbi:TetR/AcrR family transcriptional regulator [Streptomyces winkii]|uniref:TetR/AcrR family transcriptional regulator n=1 Tax=Streptomyces winkii TaxID=3051178 RepID=UPI0028CFF04C|nr:TetR/AcrR family transcriptional regulator [Streptomyces sp. DSM 40971]